MTGRRRHGVHTRLARHPLGRLAVGLVGLSLTGAGVHEDRIGPRETALFARINGLPDGIHRPVWVVMQLGNVAAGPVAAAVAYRAGHRRLAGRLVLDATVTWALSKVLKRVYRRPRPPALVAGARTRGQEPTGLGYVSGHAGISLAMAIASSPELGRAGRVAATAAAATVGLSRIYVGAHLPLDVVGGAALGIAVDAVVSCGLPESRDCRMT